MTTTLILLIILTVIIIGFIKVFNSHARVLEKINFSVEYRNKFIEFANQYFQTYDRYNRSGNFDGELYAWLTMNVSKIQNYVGVFGVMKYKPAFQNYMINNYQIIINSIPKFREGLAESADFGAVDDCLLRFIGYLEESRNGTLKNLRNPIVWFREGFREILSIPIFIMNWFGIISNGTLNSIKDSLIYKVISGIIALVTLVSGLVTILVGYNPTIEFLRGILRK